MGRTISNRFKEWNGTRVGVLSRFTWQSPQTGVGLLYSLSTNVFDKVNSVDYYGGATVVNVEASYEAVTLGTYILGNNTIKANPANELFQHEYGHYLQSKRFGPGYLGKVGIPSARSDAARHRFHSVEQEPIDERLNTSTGVMRIIMTGIMVNNQ